VKKTLYVDMDMDMDNVIVDFPSGIRQLTSNQLRDYDGRLDDVPGIFSLKAPLPGAIDAAFAELSMLFDAYILSTAPWENPSAWSDKLHWVKRHLGKAAYKRLILSHHKNLNAGDFLIDDRTRNGVDRFPGEHIHFGTPLFPDWTAVMGYLRPRA
jgi:5'(3')-deoxyribonucleotidase